MKEHIRIRIRNIVLTLSKRQLIYKQMVIVEIFGVLKILIFKYGS